LTTKKKISTKRKKSKEDPVLALPIDSITSPEEKVKPRPYHPAGIIQIDGEDILPADYSTGVYDVYSPETLESISHNTI